MLRIISRVRLVVGAMALGMPVACATVEFTLGPQGGGTSQSVLRHAVAGMKYEGCVRGYARVVDGPGELKFEKISGPAWLAVAADGTVAGTPPEGEAGKIELVVGAQAADGAVAKGAFQVQVFRPGQERVERLGVMAYNLFHGWSQVADGRRKGLRSIVLSGADVVAVVESTGGGAFLPQVIAEELGWYHAKVEGNGDVGVVSRYPIVETFAAGRAVGARIRVCGSPLREVVVYSTHLDYLHYGPYEAARPGSTNESVMKEELASRRTTEAEAMVSAMKAHLDAADACPVVVAGDFNCPSHLDWTAGAAVRHSGKVVAWPATLVLERVGLIDSFRKQHPDPVAVPGDTWAPIYTEAEPQDRIDFVFHKGKGLRLLDSRVFVTEVETKLPSYSDAGGKTIKENTWPSDHAAVLSLYGLE